MIIKTFNNVSVCLYKQKKTLSFLISGRLGWADDIDLDLSGDLSNNGYIR